VSGDRQRFAYSSADRVFVWKAGATAAEAELAVAGEVTALAFVGASDRLLVGLKGHKASLEPGSEPVGRTELLNASTGEVLATYRTESLRRVYGIAVSPDRERFLTHCAHDARSSSFRHVAHLWSIQGASPPVGLTVGNFAVSSVRAIAVSPKGEFAVGNSSGLIVRADGLTGEVTYDGIQSGEGHQGMAVGGRGVSAMQYTLDGRYLLSVEKSGRSIDVRLRVWDLEENAHVNSHLVGLGNFTSLDLSPDGKYLLVARETGVGKTQVEAWAAEAFIPR
jgi:WD40 repeat protein